MASSKNENINVLIVEDEIILAMNLEDLVRGLGFNIVGPVARLDEAIELINAKRISIALLDARLHRSQNVYPAAELLGEKGIPFILTTAYGSECLDRRFADRPVMKKPFGQRELEKQLREVLKLRWPT